MRISRQNKTFCDLFLHLSWPRSVSFDILRNISAVNASVLTFKSYFFFLAESQFLIFSQSYWLNLPRTDVCYLIEISSRETSMTEGSIARWLCDKWLHATNCTRFLLSLSDHCNTNKSPRNLCPSPNYLPTSPLTRGQSVGRRGPPLHAVRLKAAEVIHPTADEWPRIEIVAIHWIGRRSHDLQSSLLLLMIFPDRFSSTFKLQPDDTN